MKFGPQRSLAAGSSEHHFLAHGKIVWHFFYDGAGNIKVQKSVNQGYTYAAAVTIDATAGDNDVMLNEPACYDAVTGRIHILYGRSIDNAGAPPVLCHRYSTDDGATWSAEHVIDNGGTRGNNRFYRVGITAYNGVVFIAHTSESNTSFTTDGFVWYARSTDGGATFSAIAKMFTTGTVNPSEPNTYMGPDGTLHISWYDPGVAINEGGDVYYVRSLDSGVTLPSAPTQLTSGAVFGRTRIFGFNGKINIVGNSNWSVSNIADVSTMHSDDNGTTWSAPAVQASHGVGELDHPWGEQDSLLAAIIYVDFSTSPRTYGLLLSTDGGATYTAGPVPLTTTGSSDAPQLVITDDLLIATGYDNVALTYIWRVYPLFSPVVPSTPLIDQFNRANEDPLSDGGKWSQEAIAGGHAKLVSNQATRRNGAGSFDRAGDYRNDVVYTTAAEAYATIANSGAVSGEIDVILLDEPTNKNGYWMNSSGGDFSNGHTISRLAAGAGTTLQSDTVAYAAGDKSLLRITPTEVIAYRYDGSDWFELFRAADTTYRSGLRAGFNIVGLATGGQAIDDFGAGALVVPSNTVAPSATGLGDVGQVVSCGAGTWAAASGATPTKYRYQWQDSANGTTGWTNIANAALPFYTIPVGELGKYLRCVVTAINSIGSTTANSNVIGPIGVMQPITGAINATSAVVASVARGRAITPATINATSAVAASLNRAKIIGGGAINATSTIAAAVVHIAVIRATINATSALTSSVARIRHLVATVSATSAITASVSRQGSNQIAASISSTSNLTVSRISVTRALRPTISSTSSVTATFGRVRHLFTTITSTSTLTAAVRLAAGVQLVFPVGRAGFVSRAQRGKIGRVG